MASTQTWSEWNTSNTDEHTSRAECNWKNINDSTTAYTSNPVVAGTNSFWKYQAIVFAGTFNLLSSLTYKVSTATPLDSASGAGNLTIKANVASSYSTPATTASGDATASTTGESINFVTGSTPFAAGTATSATSPSYGQPWRTQLVVGGSCAPGDSASVTITASWTES